MSKLAIPAILVATVMVAGAFALMPVEQASTVHTTIGVTNVASATTVDTNASIEVIIATSATVKQGILCTQFANAGAADAPDVLTSLDATDTETIILIDDLNGDDCVTFTGHGLNLDITTQDGGDDLDWAVT